MSRISVPTTARLPSSLRISSDSPIVRKSISRLSRASLLSLAIDWLEPGNVGFADPYLVTAPRGGGRRDGDNDDDDYDDDDDDDDDDQAAAAAAAAAGDFFPPARSVEKLRRHYQRLRLQKGSKTEVANRITAGDWRLGLTLYQLAVLDFQYLYDHPSSQKWSAYRVVHVRLPSADGDDDDDGDGSAPARVDAESVVVPRFHPSTFLQRLEQQVLPDVKAHFHFHRFANLPMNVLRVFLVDSPYNTDLGLPTEMRPLRGGGGGPGLESSRTVYIAFPDASPFIYISKFQSLGSGAGSSDTQKMRRLMIEGIPQALSRPGRRCTLKPTAMNSRNIEALLSLRGPGRTNGAAAGWGIYANTRTDNDSPLCVLPPTETPGGADYSHGQTRKKRKLCRVEPKEVLEARRCRVTAEARFGDSARMSDGKGLEWFEVVIQDPFLRTRAGTAGSAPGVGPSDSGRQSHRTSNRSSIDGAFRLDESDDGNEDEDGDGRDADQTAVWAPRVSLTFHGTHVFAGVRQLVEAGIVDGLRTPGWLTGEEGVTGGIVRNGRIKGHRGSGL